MAANYGVLVFQHLQTAKKMPVKKCVFDHGGYDRSHPFRKMTNQLKRERKAIAAYYRLLRKHADYGPAAARLAHRYAQVTAGVDAKDRIKQLSD